MAANNIARERREHIIQANSPKLRSQREPRQPDHEMRSLQAATWSARIAAMLESPVKREAPGRIWRLRYFQDDDYLVATLVQNNSAAAPAPGQQQAKVVTFLTRPYTRSNATGGSTVSQQLFGDFSCDDIVAFLRLDLVDPDSGVSWRDETKYHDIIVVKDVIGNLRHGRD